MELKYLMARWRQKLVLLILSPEEEETLLKRLPPRTVDAHIFITGAWAEDGSTQKKVERLLRRTDRLVVTSKSVDSEAIGEIVCKSHVSGIPVKDVDSFLFEIDPIVPAISSQLIHHLLASDGSGQNWTLRVYDFFKFTLEPVVALVLFILLSPLMAIVALMVKLTSPGPIIYSQERVGYHGNIFRIYKFRSMRVNAEGGKPAWASTSQTDPNLTSIGSFLRSKHLDELPQLWNVILGDLSFIGPRPERPEFVKQLTLAFPLFKLRPLIKPGITGWAQVKQGYANTISDSLKKLEFDLFYIIKHSPMLDAEILFKTFWVVSRGGTEGLKRSRVKLVKAAA